MYKFMACSPTLHGRRVRMAGVEAHEAANAEEARRVLPGLLQEEDAGIIAVSEEFMQGLDDRLAARIDRRRGRS